MKAIWEEIKSQIRAELPRNTYALWIDSIRFLEAKQDTVILNCPNKFSRDWVMEQLGGGRFLTDCKGYGLLKKRGVDL